MNIKEVARRARVSTATVSRFMNGTARLNQATAERVQKAIADLGYYPNTLARSLVSGRSRILGLIISDISNPFFPQLVKACEDAAIRKRYELFVTNTNYDPQRMQLCVRRMIERSVDGVAIMTSEMEPHLIDELARRNMPIAFLDVGKVSARSSNIRIDYPAGIAAAIAHLVELGHERIGFIAGPPNLTSARVRQSAFLSSLRKRGLIEDERLVQVGDHRIEGGYAAMRRLLALRRRPTAVLASNDLSAMGALAAINQAGLRVPQDVSIVGFDDISLAAVTQPPLTTVHIPLNQLGLEAVRVLTRVIEGEGEGEEVRVGTRLIVRESTAGVAVEKLPPRKPAKPRKAKR